MMRGGSLIWAMALAPTPVTGQTPPPPPPMVVEFFAPTVRDHSVSAKCGPGRAELGWTFDGATTHLRVFSFGGRPLPSDQTARMQAWMTEIGGDVLIDFECWADAASFRIIGASGAGTGAARLIRVNLVDGVLSEAGRSGF